MITKSGKESPNNIAKMMGFTGTKDVSAMTNRTYSTLYSWWRDDYEFFIIVLEGCVAVKTAKSRLKVGSL